MFKILHILNGDSTLHQFQAAGLSGNTFVWREVLSDGPVNVNFASNKFWSERDEFMTSEFKLTESRYKTDLVEPFIKMNESLSDYEEIVLWFEYDLFCQINMVALIQWLGKQELNSTVSLICPGKMDDSDRLFGLGEISADKYVGLFESRIKLGSREFEFCNDVYEAYCSADPNDLYNYVLMTFSEFPYLPDAIEAHFRRFPDSDTGLTEIELVILDFIKEGETDSRKLVGKMLNWQKYHGFGDLQYANILDTLSPLFTDFESLELKPNLDKVEVRKLLNRENWLGGAQLKHWSWNRNEKTLIPEESAS